MVLNGLISDMFKISIYDGLNSSFQANCTPSMYHMETLFPNLLRKSEFFTTDDTADFYLIPHDSTCFYHDCVFEQKRAPAICKEEAGDYMATLLNQVIHNYPNWNLTGGTDHLLVFSWDQASEVLGWDHPVRGIIQNAIHLTTLGSVHVNPNFNPHKDIVVPPFLNATRAFRMFPNPKIKFNQIMLSYLNLLPFKFGFINHNSWPHNKRRIWGYFRGTILSDMRYSFGVRQSLLQLKSSKSLVKFMIEQGHSSTYLQELGDSVFSLCPSGWSLWSPRLFESIFTASIPVVFANGIRLPFETDISYRDFIIKIKNENVDMLENILMSFDADQIRQKRENMVDIRHHLAWNDPPLPKDSFYMTMQQLERKIARNKPVGYDEF